MSIISALFAFIIKALFYAAMFPLILRMMFEFAYASPNNQVVKAVNQLTQKVIQPISDKSRTVRRICLNTLMVWLVTDVAKFVFIVSILKEKELSGYEYLFLIPADFVMQVTIIIFYATCFYYILRFVAPKLPHPIMGALAALSQPACRGFRRIIPVVKGFDISPILVMIVTKSCQILILRVLPPNYFF